MLADHFARFTRPGRYHFAAHSHHLWPDVTFEAQQKAWLDAADLVDEKWDRVFGDVVAATQGHVARILSLPDPATVAVAPNTHELVVRLASCLPDPFTVVTSDAEFHSFRRQAARWEEAGRATVIRVPAEPFDTFPSRLGATIGRADPDLVYVSHVFYDSGYVVPVIEPINAAVARPETFVVIDGYHSFMAVPVDLETLAHRTFYVAGGYKYAMAGEGVCFMHCPPGYGPRPVDTGWMSAFGALTSTSGTVEFGEDGTRFLGATFDPTPFYRFNAVQDLLLETGVDVAAIHGHVLDLMRRFVAGLPNTGDLAARTVIPAWDPAADRGHFVTFRTDRAGELRSALRDRGVITDQRGDRLRFGFGVYHDASDVDALLGIVASLG